MGGWHHEYGAVPVSARQTLVAFARDLVATLAPLAQVHRHPDVVEEVFLAAVVAVPVSLALFMMVSP
jgi:hypothetical protein